MFYVHIYMVSLKLTSLWVEKKNKRCVQDFIFAQKTSSWGVKKLEYYCAFGSPKGHTKQADIQYN